MGSDSPRFVNVREQRIAPEVLIGKARGLGRHIDYGDSVRELFVHGCLHFKLELTTFLYVNQIPVTDFIVVGQEQVEPR